MTSVFWEASIFFVEFPSDSRGRQDINNWLKLNVHQYGLMKSPTEIIKDSCNSCIDTKPIINYYIDKYSKIYNL